MNQPWGLSGPQFLGVYAAGLAAVIVISLLTRQLARWLPGRSNPAAPRELDAYQAGYLAGGPRRAAEVIVAELTQAGALRVSSAGHVTLADAGLAAASPAVRAHGVRLDRLPSGAKTNAVLRALARDPGVTGLGPELSADGLVAGPAGRRAALVVAGAAAAALHATAIARFLEAAANHRPAGNLTGLFILSLVVCLFLIVGLARQPRRTARGARCLRQLRQANRDAASAPAAVPGWAGAPYYQDSPAPGGFGPPGAAAGAALSGAALSGTALLGVALLGFGAVDDTQLRNALLAGMPSSSSGGGSDGGGSDGGGGCGGGGCGGGCGG